MQTVIGLNCPWCSHPIIAISPDLNRALASVVPTRDLPEADRVSQLGCPSCERNFFAAWHYAANKPAKVLSASATREQLRQLATSTQNT